MKPFLRFLCCLCLLTGSSSFGVLQQPSTPVFRKIISIPIETKNVQSDAMNNLYTISLTNQLNKYNRDGRLTSTLNYTYSGNISSLDVSNPMEIYLFYKELNTILFLDNNLALRGQINLSDYSIGQASAVARSYDNGIWAFDISDLQLKKLDKNGNIVQASGNIRQFLNGNTSPHEIIDNNNRVFVNDSANGVFVFDVFCAYIKTIPIKGANKIKVHENALFCQTGQTLLRYDLVGGNLTTISIPDSAMAFQGLLLDKERLFIQRKNNIDVYAH